MALSYPGIRFNLINNGKSILFTDGSNNLLKVIEWNDDTTNTIVYRYPMSDRNEIMNGCQLVEEQKEEIVVTKHSFKGEWQ